MATRGFIMASTRLRVEQQQRIEQIRDAVRRKDPELLESAVTGFPTIDYENGEDVFPDSALRLFLELTSDPTFLEMQGSHHIFILLLANWHSLQSQHRSKLPAAFSAAYGGLADPLSCQIISDILGRFFGDEEAVRLLSRFSESGPSYGRALSAVGLGMIATNCDRSDVAQAALEALRKMRDDLDDTVREESRLALARAGQET